MVDTDNVCDHHHLWLHFCSCTNTVNGVFVETLPKRIDHSEQIYLSEHIFECVQIWTGAVSVSRQRRFWPWTSTRGKTRRTSRKPASNWALCSCKLCWEGTTTPTTNPSSPRSVRTHHPHREYTLLSARDRENTTLYCNATLNLKIVCFLEF